MEGSSVDATTKDQVSEKVGDAKNLLVILDSFHTHEHVLMELEMYHSFVSHNSYLIVFDTVIEYLSHDMFQDHPWGVGNNPMTALNEFLETNGDFEIDKDIHEKLQISVAPNGYLKCSRN